MILKKYYKISVICLFIFLSFLVLLTGCSSFHKNESKVAEEENAEEVLAITNPVEQKEPYTLLIESDKIKVALNEPQNGCYLGAYILANKQLNFEINNFEKLTEKKHALYMYNLKLGDDIPHNWILGCISKLKTPNIVIKPPNEYDPFDENLLIKTARELGEYNIPMFVQFYPNPATKKYESQQYKDFFKRAKKLFSQFAPNISLVFSIKNDEMVDYKTYYPGDDAVDWVGLNIYENIESDENVYGSDIFSSIDYFYYTFQKTKPIMISQFGVSYYSTKNNIYYSNEAKEEITRVYENLIKYYPRIKAITYMDFNGIGMWQDSKDNFSITENESILQSYKKVISNEYFLSRQYNNKEIVDPELIKSPFDVYKIEDVFYISEKSITYDMNLSGISSIKQGNKTIDGEQYFELGIIESNNIRKIQVDEVDKKIILRK